MQPTVESVPGDFRRRFVFWPDGEVARAYAIFGGLFLALAVIGGQLAFRELGVQVLQQGVDLGNVEARRIAETLTRVGRDGETIDFSRIQRNRSDLTAYIRGRLAARSFIRHVEVVDRFGVRQLFVARRREESVPGANLARSEFPAEWQVTAPSVVSAPLGFSEGRVVLGVAMGPMLSELDELRASLRLKIAVAGAMAVAVLISGFFYVLYLIRKNRRLEEARQSAARASYVGLLAAGLAHEIRNPLNAMNMNLQMLEEELQGARDVEPDECSELLTDTKAEIKRLEGLVNNFLAYARPSTPQFETVDLNQAILNITRFLDADFKRAQVELATRLEPLLPAVDLDERQFRQALINLLVNARQVLKNGGKVEVRTRAGSGGDVVIEIEDDGPGIPEEARERIFEIFYSSRGGGTGLGLPIAKQVVERHRGRIELRTEIGRGTCFEIHLPRRQGTRVDGAEAGA